MIRRFSFRGRPRFFQRRVVSKFSSTRFLLERPTVAKKSRAKVGLEGQNDGVTEQLAIPDWDRGGRNEKGSLTPLYASMKKVIDANPGCVCLIQVGSFYELYFEQAEEYGPKLGLKVATRKTSNHSIPMAGFPVFQLQKFVKILVQDLEVNIAIIDQYEKHKRSSDNIIHRKISRIVSPGTLVDETFLNYNQNNYLVAIAMNSGCTKYPATPDMPVGLSWIDLSVGEFFVQETTLESLVGDLSRINPSEIIISKEFQEDNLVGGLWYAGLSDIKKYFVRYHDTVYKDLKLQFKSSLQETRKKLESFSQKESMAMNMILSYINVNLPDADPTLDIPVQYRNKECLQMDARTREALELTERSTSGGTSVVGSFLNTIKRTVTTSGTRMLTQWIKSPILDVTELRRRQSFVALFKERRIFTTTLRQQLSQIGDVVRSVQKLVFNSGDTISVLHSIADSLQKLELLENLLREEAKSESVHSHTLESFLADFLVPKSIADKIHSTLSKSEEFHDPASAYEESLAEVEYSDSGSYRNSSVEKYRVTTDKKDDLSYVFAVRKDYSPELEQVHQNLDKLLLEEKDLIKQILGEIKRVDPKVLITKRMQHGRFSNVLYISGKQKLISEIYNHLEKDVRDKRKGSLILKPVSWGKLQSLIDDQVDIIREAEREIIQSLRAEVLDYISDIGSTSRLVDYLDITSSFAILAEEFNLVCPKFVKSPHLNITDGRHIVVESGLRTVSEMFTPNSTKVGSDGILWVISGPNMGGKSTYLRQNALIVILAQIGSYVPAAKASLGILDKIFTRIGASDDLFSDLSTFMVEMIETSNILKNATPRSLAIVDEIGRGTSGKEGLAIAYATLLHLLQVNKCQTLFATHFGKEIESLLERDKIPRDKIRFYRTRVVESDGADQSLDFIIDHSLEEGISERSYALEVAKMAGFPETALQKAKKALALLD